MIEFDPLLNTIAQMLRAVDEHEARALAQALLDAPLILVGGHGRLRDILRCFAARLTELGLRCQVIGDATESACHQGALVLLASGSGRNPSLLVAAEKAVVQGAKVALLTGAALSPLARLAHLRVVFPPLLPGITSPTVIVTPPDESTLVAELRTVFEQAVFIFLEALVPALMTATRQSRADLEARRPNLD